MDKKSQRTESLKLVLSQVSRELDGLATLSEQIQLTIGELIEQDSGEVSDAFYQLQGLDLLGQSVTAIAEFVDALAIATPNDIFVDARQAAQSVRLWELRARLALEPGDLDPNDSSDTGGIALF